MIQQRRSQAQRLTANDGVTLGRDQRADVCCHAGRVSRIVDHPLNGPLMGMGPVELLRAAELTLRPGERSVAVYSARAGRPCRAATARIVETADGTLSLAQWHIEPGFTHESEWSQGRVTHRITVRPV